MLPNATPEEIGWGAAAIYDCVRDTKPFFIGRNGSCEIECLGFWYENRRGPSPVPYPKRILHLMSHNAGVWPATDASVDAWATEYATALGTLDGLAAGWYKPFRALEQSLLEAFAPQAFTTPLRSLEPYYSEPSKRWTALLKGQRVAIVTSFADTVLRQIMAADHYKKIWAAVPMPETILDPTVEWIPVKTFYSPNLGAKTAWPAGITSWGQAVDYTVENVIKSGASTAIIGCGGLSMIIAARLKAVGISAFVLGGAIQVLFGIKGVRWMGHDVISKFWNGTWVWPSTAETPTNAGLVEGACYWGPVLARAPPNNPTS